MPHRVIDKTIAVPRFKNIFQALQLKIQGLFKYFQGLTLFSSSLKGLEFQKTEFKHF